jgi:hypothetical protein
MAKSSPRVNLNANETYRRLREQRRHSEKWVPDEEIKRDLFIGDKKLRALLRANVIPNIPIGGGKRLVPRNAYTKWLQTGNTAA